MTTNTQALQRLLDAVEAGTATLYDFSTWRPGLTGTKKESAMMLRAYNGSLDAAKALHDALLPGWDLLITTYEDGLFEVSVSEPLVVKTYDGLSEIIARAWLIAIIRAVMAGER